MPDTVSKDTASEEGPRPYPWLYRVLKPIVVPLVHGISQLRVEGLEHVPRHGAAILCANHLSFLDPVIVAAVVPRPVFYLGKSDHFTGLQRHFFEAVGVIPIAREGGAAAEQSLELCEHVLQGGNLLGIYPEGTRSPDGRLYKGKTGPVRLAVRAGVPIIPIGVLGMWEVMMPGTRIPRRLPVTVRFGRSIDFGRLAGRDHDRVALRSATDALMYEIMRLSGQRYVDRYAADMKVRLASSTSLDKFDQVDDDDELPGLESARSA